MTAIEVEIWSDVVCPWCYIGKRRFEAGLEDFLVAHPDVEVRVAYRAFQLDPLAPSDRSEPVRDAYVKKFGGEEAADAIIERVTREAAGEGIEFRLDRALRANTASAHRLLALAERLGREDRAVDQGVVKERLMTLYFTEGGDLGDRAALISVGAECGIEPEEVRAWLDGDGGRAEVADQLELAAAFGISSVPTFVIDRRVGVPGAQPAEVFTQVLAQAVASGGGRSEETS